MRRWMLGMTIAGIVLSAGACYGQEGWLPPTPQKVRTMLEKFVGTWNWQDEMVQGTSVCRWDPAGNYVICQDEAMPGGVRLFATRLIGWDGVSQDEIVMYEVGPAIHDSSRLRIVSDTIMEGEGAGVWLGNKYSDKVRWESQGADQFRIVGTLKTDGSEPPPTSTTMYTRLETTDDAQELIRLEEELARAFIERDMAVIDRINADSMSLGTSEGKFITKDDVLGYVRSDKFDIDSMACEDLRAKVYGDMAVVTGKIRWTDKKGGSGQELITDVFLKRDSRWQMVATHASKITDDKAEEPSRSSSETNKAVFRRLLAEITNDPKMESFEEVLHEDFVFHGPGGYQLRGIDAFKDSLEYVRKVFPDYHEAEETTIAQGDFVASRWTSTGTHVKNGKKFKMTNMTIDRFLDGKIVEIWYLCDNLTRQKQLGLEDVFALD